MGRNRKFQEGDVVWWGNLAVGEAVSYGVIVDWRTKTGGHTMYRVLRLTGEPSNSQLYGPAVWKETWDLMKFGPTYKRAPGTYRRNQAIPDRGCSCNCCVHVALPLREVRPDGTFKGDDDAN